MSRSRPIDSPEACPPVGAWLPSGWRAPLVMAALVRAFMLLPSVGEVFRGDEPAYVALSEAWAGLGAYAGQWPPLHPALIALCDRLFGTAGEPVARVVLTLLSVWSCAWVMALTLRAHSASAARIAGWTFALYLPLLPFAHVLLSEGLVIALLLPAATLLLAAAQSEAAGGRGTLALLGAGALVGLSCLARDSGLFWLVALTAWCLFALRTGGTSPLALRRAALFAGAALVTISPWSVAATRSIGSFQLLGRTAGVNAYMGWNADYVNFDLVGLDVPGDGVPGAALRASLLAPPDGVQKWDYEFVPHLGERDRLQVRRGSEFIRDHPGFFLRTRVVKAADLATPLSFMTRFLRMPAGDPSARGLARSGGYDRPLHGTQVRLFLSLFAVLAVLAVTLLGAYGSTVVRLRHGAASLMLAGLAATAPLAMVVAMSRFRAPYEALLIVPAAAALATLGRGASQRRPGAAPRLTLALALALLAGAWYLSIPAVVATFRVLL